jgi:hypothetical protein
LINKIFNILIKLTVSVDRHKIDKQKNRHARKNRNQVRDSGLFKPYTVLLHTAPQKIKTLGTLSTRGPPPRKPTITPIYKPPVYKIGVEFIHSIRIKKEAIPATPMQPTDAHIQRNCVECENDGCKEALTANHPLTNAPNPL